MAAWARIAGGAVAELTDLDPHGRFHPGFTWVPCDATVRERWSFDGTNFAAPPPPPAPSPLAVALAGPLTVTCTSLAALDGAYAIDSDTRQQITAIAASINAGLGLPGGGATFSWFDATGTAHPWPAVQFTGLWLFCGASGCIGHKFSEALL